MRPGPIPYFFRQAAANIRNNPLVHGIAMVTMVISLLILGAFLILYVNINALMQQWGHSLSISIYLEDGLDEVRTERIREIVLGLPGAEIRRFISKEQALRDFREALGPRAGLLDGMSGNPLPASIEVVFREQAALLDPEETKKGIEALEGVQEVEYSREWIRRFEGVMRVVGMAGFAIGGFLCLGVLFIVINTIKLTIYNRKEEIEILQLVGATDWFIKAPFLVEGAIQGAISGVVSIGAIYLGYTALTWRRLFLFGIVPLDFVFMPYSYSIAIVTISILFGLVGSFIAVGRFFQM